MSLGVVGCKIPQPAVEKCLLHSPYKQLVSFLFCLCLCLLHVYPCDSPHWSDLTAGGWVGALSTSIEKHWTLENQHKNPWRALRQGKSLSEWGRELETERDDAYLFFHTKCSWHRPASAPRGWTGQKEASGISCCAAESWKPCRNMREVVERWANDTQEKYGNTAAAQREKH